MNGLTLRGVRRMLAIAFQGETPPVNFYLALVQASPAPTALTTVMSGLTQVANGNGYVTGGIQLDRDAVDFDVLTEDTTGLSVYIQIRDVSWTASGGSIASASYAVLTNDHATIGSREVWAYWAFGAPRTITVGRTLPLADLEIAVV
jgi:hypothetical protein